jgi:hypothetical protein
MRYLMVLLVTLFTLPAWAADPECEDPARAYDVAVHGYYDATTTIAFCTPKLSEAGEVLIPGDLTGCTVYAKGSTYPVEVTEPERLVAFTVTEEEKAGTRFGNFRVSCSTAAGEGEAAEAVAYFRGVTTPPGKPTLLRQGN